MIELHKILPPGIRERFANYILERRGLQPKGTYSFSKSGSVGRYEDGLALPNLSRHLNGVMCGFMKHYGLGSKCLLLSENNEVKRVLAGAFPEPAFTTADYYADLQGDNVDCCWDACMEPPLELKQAGFTSCVCNALLEHTIDPTAVLAHVLSIIEPQGHLFLMTHTPSFFCHRYPRDYVRFFHDYFEDIPGHMLKKHGMEVELMELWSRSGIVNVCYRRG
jgi:hypothetical protein